MSPVGPLSRRDRRSGRPALPTALVVELLLVVALGWVLWVTARAEAAKAVAAAGHGRPGVMVIESLRPARGNDIPVGTFTDSDGTKTSGVAWQDRPARLGDRKGGVRVGNRAWGDGVRLGVWDVLVTLTVILLLVWRLVRLLRVWRAADRPAFGAADPGAQ